MAETPNEREWDADDFLLEMLHPAWHQQAACRGMDPELFFPERYEGVTEAKSVCRGCPVRDRCDEAGETESWGVWGGRGPLERRRRRRSLRQLELVNDR